VRIPLSPHGVRELTLLTLGCALLGWGLALVAWPLALLPAALWVFGIAFFRDPERKLPADPQALVSPADGTVTDVVEVEGAPLLPERCLRVGIFLSVFDVHVNRAPMTGRVAGLRYQPGRFLDARDPAASRENEAQDILIEGDSPALGPVLVRQIAGLIARRIVCPLQVGASVERGGRIGMIKFGSRTELLVPLRLAPRALVRVGEKVRGTATACVSIGGASST
jgi:phosphatidylserine decarboxylase